MESTQAIITTLAMIAGVLLSIIAENIPAYGKLDQSEKRIVMAVLLILAGGVIYGVSCVPIVGLVLGIIIPGARIACTQEGIIILVQAILLAVAANQGFHSLAYRGNGSDPVDPATDAASKGAAQ